jgi:excisionase family DNA binding protein
MNTTQPDDQDQMILLTAREAAFYLRVSLSTLYRMEQRGKLTSLRTPGGHRRYTLQMLNACLTYAQEANRSLPDFSRSMERI